MTALTATLVNHHYQGWPADMNSGPTPSRDSESDQPSTGFTAVNGRPKGSSTESSPHQNGVFSPSTRDQSYEFAYPRHERHGSDNSLKRKRPEAEAVSPASSTSQRQLSQSSPRISAPASQSYASPLMTREVDSAANKPYNMAWQRQSDEHLPEARRLVEAMQQDQDRDSDEKPSPADSSDAAVSQSPYSSHMSVPPGPGQQIPVPVSVASASGYAQKARKRNFTNRTKTGCLTCRERKKKCDETKPTCTNCSRGGFSCKGYPNANFHKSAMSREHPTLQAKHDYPQPIPHPIGYTPAPTHFAPNPPHYPPQPYGEPYSRPLGPPREPARPALQESRPEYMRPPPPSWQHQDPYQPAPMQPHAPPHLPPHAPPHHYQQPPPHDMRPPPHMMPYETARDHHRVHSAPQHAPELARSSPFKDRDALVSTANSALYDMSSGQDEYQKMVNHKPFFPADEGLRSRRRACAKALKRYHDESQLVPGIDEKAAYEALKSVIEGQETEDKSMGTQWTYPSPHGLGKNVEVQTPFHCDYSVNIHIGDNAIVGANCRVENACTVSIGSNSIVGANCCFYSASPVKLDKLQLQSGSRQVFKGDPIKVCDNVIIGPNCVIMQGVTIPEGSVVPPGSLVERDGTRAKFNPVSASQLRHR